jgi:hypothetical protein
MKNRKLRIVGAALAASGAVVVATPGLAGAHGRPSAPEPDPTTSQVYVTHGLPLDDTGTIVDVYAGPAGSGPAGANLLIDDFSFGDTKGPLALPAASYSVYLAAPTADDDGALAAGEVIYTQDLAVPAGQNLSVVASLTAAGAPTLAVFANDVSRTPRWKGRLSVRHAAAAPAVDVSVGAIPWVRWYPELARTVGPASNGQAADLVLAGWRYDISVKVAGTDTVVDGVKAFPVYPRTLTNVYAVGAPGSTFQFVTQTIPLGRTDAD